MIWHHLAYDHTTEPLAWLTNEREGLLKKEEDTKASFLATDRPYKEWRSLVDVSSWEFSMEASL
jgi:hypothetical protein